jgi:PPK2 family polyphosphate:nucleotide phosphotransferase
VKYVKRFVVTPGAEVKLKDIDPGFKDHHKSHKEAADEIEHLQKKLRNLQELLYADGRRSLLICLQGMDTGGKDGTINHILGAMNPQGCRVVGFRQPSAAELAHDFLWRIHRAVPSRGEVAIFNRSHYEDVLVVRVHNLVPKSVWSRRYQQINAFERGLVEANTHFLKFYLHISKQEQLSRFKQRLDDPAKQWKISEADYTERKFWGDYAAAYEDVLSRCSHPVRSQVVPKPCGRADRRGISGRVGHEIPRALGGSRSYSPGVPCGERRLKVAKDREMTFNFALHRQERRNWRQQQA